MNEIVAIIIDENIITNRWDIILEAVACNKHIRPLNRVHMQFMANADLGQNWTNLASGPTLFLINEDGEFVLPENKD